MDEDQAKINRIQNEGITAGGNIINATESTVHHVTNNYFNVTPTELNNIIGNISGEVQITKNATQEIPQIKQDTCGEAQPSTSNATHNEPQETTSPLRMEDKSSTLCTINNNTIQTSPGDNTTNTTDKYAYVPLYLTGKIQISKNTTHDILQIKHDTLGEAQPSTFNTTHHYEEDSSSPLHMEDKIHRVNTNKTLLDDTTTDKNDYGRLHSAAAVGNLEDITILLNQGYPVDHDVEGTTPLMVSAKNGQLKIVQLLLNKEAKVQMKNKEGCTALTLAAAYNNTQIVDVILQHCKGHKNYSVLARAALKATCLLKSYKKGTYDLALYYAAFYGYYDIVVLLLEYGISPEYGKDGYSPIYVAAQEDRLDIIKLLVKYDANVFAKSPQGASALSIAAQKGHNDVVSFLLQFYNHGIIDDLAIYCAATGGHKDVVLLLLKHGFPIEYNFNGYTPLSIAANNGHLETVELLLQRKANVQGENFNPVVVSASFGHLNIIKLLIEWGGDMFAKTPGGVSAISIAAQNGHRHVVEYLLQFYKDGSIDDLGVYFAANSGHNDLIELFLEKQFPIECCYNYYTPLSVAARKGYYETVKLLLERGANIQGKEFNPIIIAANFGQLNIIELLVEWGADVFAKTPDGISALSIAVQNNHKHVVEYLLQFYTQNTIDDLGLYSAATKGHNDLVVLLLEHGFPLECSFNGYTPLSAATYHGHLETVKLLLKRGAYIHRGKNNPVVVATKQGHKEIKKHLKKFTNSTNTNKRKCIIT